MTNNSAVLELQDVVIPQERPKSAVSELLEETIRMRRESLYHDGLADSSLAVVAELLDVSPSLRNSLGF